MLQNRGSTRYFSTKTKKTKTSDLSTKSHTHWEACFKTNFFSLVNFGTPLSPEALCPLAEPLPPNSAGAAGVVMAGLTTELTARFLEGERGLRRRKAIKNKHKTSKSTSSYSPITVTSGGGPPLLSPCRLDGWLIRRPVMDV